jgi:hypothetical protein
MSKYLLPFHPSLKTDDPLGIYYAEEEPFIPQAVVLKELLGKAHVALAEEPNAASKIFVSLLEDIAYTIHGNGSLNTATLNAFLSKSLSIEDAERAIWNIVQAASELEAPCWLQELPYLTEENSVAALHGDLAKCLLAHEALGTLSSPYGNTWGILSFLSWYDDSPHHPDAVHGYLCTMFDYWQKPTRNVSSVFRLYSANDMPDPCDCTRTPDLVINVIDKIYEPSDHQDKVTPFVLVAANQQPGPGPTGTQEERLQASSPLLTLASLLCPVIPENAAIITSALPVLASWTGHNRSARLQHIYAGEDRPSRHYILADALPLDEVDDIGHDQLPDFLTGNVEREVKKLYAAFWGAAALSKETDMPRCVVESPPWGCGAFGGNIVVKAICIMIAAGLTRVQVRLSFTEDKVEDIRVLRRLQAKNPSVATLWNILTGQNCQTMQNLLHVIAAG